MTTSKPINPWVFVPVLYFLQSIPVAMVQDTATILYKSLGHPNEAIATWTSLAALPWALQFLLGPVVDLIGRKRNWVTGTHLGMGAILALIPFAIGLPNGFAVSLTLFATMAVFSVLGNIAQDGFYLLTLPKDRQAAFAGVQTTSSRIGTLFSKGLLVLAAGLLFSFPSLIVRVQGPGVMTFSPKKDVTVTAPAASLELAGQDLAGVSLPDAKKSEKFGTLVPPVSVPPTVKRLAIAEDGTVTGDGRTVGRIEVTGGGTLTPVTSVAPFDRYTGWSIALIGAALLYIGGAVYLRFALPRPDDDRAASGNPGPVAARTLGIVGLALSGYFAVNAAVRLIANAIATDATKGWRLPEKNLIVGQDFGLGPVTTEIVQLVVCVCLASILFGGLRRSLRGTEMGEAFASYFRQSGILSILFFLMFYRFGEAMVAKMSPLFLQDAVEKGGLGLDTATVGTIKGVVGVVGIILGGILGGLFVSKRGLRRSFWTLAICMHLPILLYLLAAVVRPPTIWMYPIDFVDQFGYGFGFAGYMIFQMRVAQRGNFRTTHYAMGVGIGAMFISVAGIISGKLQEAIQWPGFFAAAAIMAIPGLLAVRLIPAEIAEG